MKRQSFMFFIAAIIVLFFACQGKKSNTDLDAGKGSATPSNGINIKPINLIEIIPNKDENTLSVFIIKDGQKEKLCEYDYMTFWKEDIFYFTNGSVIGRLPKNNDDIGKKSNPESYNYEIFYIANDKKMKYFGSGKGFSLFIDKSKEIELALILKSKGKPGDVDITENNLQLVNDSGETIKEYIFETLFYPETFYILDKEANISFALYSMEFSSYYNIDMNNLELHKIKDEHTEGH